MKFQDASMYGSKVLRGIKSGTEGQTSQKGKRPLKFSLKKYM